jgi:hypothetical protein
MQPTNGPVPGQPKPDPQQMSRELDALGKLASAPAFLDLLQEISDAPEDQRDETARRLATVDELKRRGLPVTDANRLTLRYFEERPGEPLRGAVTDAPHDEGPADPGLPPGVILADDDEGGDALFKDWTICATTGYINGTILVCSSVGTKALTDELQVLPE